MEKEESRSERDLTKRKRDEESPQHIDNWDGWLP
jgi:hypothetical protein